MCLFEPIVVQSNTRRIFRFRVGLASLLVTLFGGLIVTVQTAGGCIAADDLKSVTVEVRVGKKTVRGKLVEYTNQQLVLLRRDGRLLEFRTSEINELRQVSNYFTPYTSKKLQEHYRKIFGDQYEVTRLRHYVVVHPRGMRKQWADPFDELYNRFWYYFSVRDFTLSQPGFPMVVVVFNTRGEFNRVADKDGLGNPGSYAGYYSPTSNWIVTFQGAGPRGEDWENNETLIHEALHQFAFNHGIHQRWAPTPKWCAEGLASMFETRGVNNNQQFRERKDRVIPGYVEYLKRSFGNNQLQGRLETVVSSDRLFEENTAMAYSLSWALAFYLAETQPGEFNRYLRRVARRKRLGPYTSSDRVADFAESFGGEFVLLESHLQRFITDLN